MKPEKDLMATTGPAISWDEAGEHLLALYVVSSAQLTCWVIAHNPAEALMLAWEHDGDPLGTDEGERINMVVYVHPFKCEDARAVRYLVECGEEVVVTTILEAAVAAWRPRVVAAEAWTP